MSETTYEVVSGSRVLPEHNTASNEAIILESAVLLRQKIIDIQAEHMERQRRSIATTSKLGKWLLTRRTLAPLPDITFDLTGLDDSPFMPDYGDMTVTTAPIVSSREAGKGETTHAWVFQLACPIPGMMLGGEHTQIYEFGNYSESSIDIFRLSANLEEKQKWFTVNPDNKHISCWQQAKEGKTDFFMSLGDVIAPTDDAYNENQPTDELSRRVHELYSPTAETGELLLGVIHDGISALGPARTPRQHIFPIATRLYSADY